MKQQGIVSTWGIWHLAPGVLVSLGLELFICRQPTHQIFTAIQSDQIMLDLHILFVCQVTQKVYGALLGSNADLNATRSISYVPGECRLGECSASLQPVWLDDKQPLRTKCLAGLVMLQVCNEVVAAVTRSRYAFRTACHWNAAVDFLSQIVCSRSKSTRFG